MRWTTRDLGLLEFDPELNQGDVVTVAVSIPAGVITIMSAIEIHGRLLVLKRAHMHGDAGANSEPSEPQSACDIPFGKDRLR